MEMQFEMQLSLQLRIRLSQLSSVVRYVPLNQWGTLAIVLLRINSNNSILGKIHRRHCRRHGRRHLRVPAGRCEGPRALSLAINRGNHVT